MQPSSWNEVEADDIDTDARRGGLPPRNPEEIQRITVDPEDRLAFRVGVNVLTLILLGLGGWLLWRNFWG